MQPDDRSNWARASELLNEILELPSAQRAEAASRLGCRHGVQRELEQLVAGASRPSVLDGPLDAVLQALPARLVPRHAFRGRRFGAWLLQEEIGRGGMSVVYLATREGDGYTQQGALKILSMAFLNDEHVASFLRERRILSELTHPAIARLIDGGVTPEGAPYLVMERVVGQRIDLWCREREASARQIVQLVERIGRAAAHAHRHLVVHRDINPANVLVDGNGRPHLVDFGIAKLLGAAESGVTLLAFTPEFAAPEQVRGETVTTATDVYGLGRLLDCLLPETGRDRDLELAVRVASHPDPEQRYTTAKSFADDLRAWLDSRPLKARPDSLAYRARKFADRNWQWLSAAALAVLIAGVGILGTLRQAEISQREADKHEAVANFMLHLFEQADLMQAGAHLRVTDLLETAAKQARTDATMDPEARAALLSLIASGQLELSNYEAAAEALDEAESLIAAHGISTAGRAAWLQQKGKQAFEQGEFARAVGHLEDALGLLADEPAHRRSYYLAGATLVSYLVDAEDYDQALVLAERLLAELAGQPENLEVLVPLAHRHAVALEVNGAVDEALARYRSALELQRRFQPDNLLARAAILSDFGIALYFADRFAESEAINREVLRLYSEQLSPPHPRIASSLHNLAFSLVGQEGLDEAVELLTRSHAMTVELHGADHVDSLLEQVTLGTVLARTGRYAQAERLFRENIAAIERAAPDMHVLRGSVHSYLGDVLLQTGRLAESEAEYRTALSFFDALPPENIRVVEVRARLQELDGRQGRIEAAPAGSGSQ